jgi:hypothetical protein
MPAPPEEEYRDPRCGDRTGIRYAQGEFLRRFVNMDALTHVALIANHDATKVGLTNGGERQRECFEVRRALCGQ